jgi:hypothetical protein
LTLASAFAIAAESAATAATASPARTTFAPLSAATAKAPSTPAAESFAAATPAFVVIVIVAVVVGTLCVGIGNQQTAIQCDKSNDSHEHHDSSENVFLVHDDLNRADQT